VHADSRVDEYIGGLPGWQQAVCQQVRRLVHAADPDVEETVKRSVRPYFVLQGNICALLAAKDHVNKLSASSPVTFGKGGGGSPAPPDKAEPIYRSQARAQAEIALLPPDQQNTMEGRRSPCSVRVVLAVRAWPP
jgi:hypothetical protein